MIRGKWIAAPILGAALGLAAHAAEHGALHTHTVTIEGVQFVPQEITVDPGDAIVWVNKDPFPHTATAEDGAFSSPAIPAGGQWRTVVKKSGKHAYICTLHMTMKGLVTVR